MTAEEKKMALIQAEMDRHVNEDDNLSELVTEMMPDKHKNGWRVFSLVTKRMCRNSCCCCLFCSKVCLTDERHEKVKDVIDETIEMNLACLGCCRLCVMFPIYYLLYLLACLLAGCYAWVVLHPQSGFCIAESAIIYYLEPTATTLKMFQAIIGRFFFLSGQHAEVCL